MAWSLVTASRTWARISRSWERLGATAESPACLVLDGPNPLVKGEESRFGPHGYLTLAFDGPQLIERIAFSDRWVAGRPWIGRLR